MLGSEIPAVDGGGCGGGGAGGSGVSGNVLVLACDMRAYIREHCQVLPQSDTQHLCHQNKCPKLVVFDMLLRRQHVLSGFSRQSLW